VFSSLGPWDDAGTLGGLEPRQAAHCWPGTGSMVAPARNTTKRYRRAPAHPGGAGFSPLRTEFVGCPIHRWWIFAIPGRSTWRLTADLRFECVIGGKVRRFTVPKGYETNFASTPWYIRWLFPADGPWTPIAVVHDWLYSQGLAGGSRLFADTVFLEGLRMLSVPEIMAVPMYLGVRAGGRSHFGVSA
jgi:hypothetical protein